MLTSIDKDGTRKGFDIDLIKKNTAFLSVTDNPEIIYSADALIIPGVGVFAVGMERLKEKN